MRSLFLVAAIIAMAGRLRADCLNEVASLNPNERTMATNITVMVVPVQKFAVQKAIDEAYPLTITKPKLLPVPDEFGFLRGTHPVLAFIALSNDIQQRPLSIDGPLRVSNLLVPFLGRPGDKTPFIAPLMSFIAGTDESKNNYVAGLIPALVSSVGGLPAALGSFLPQGEAYQDDGTDPEGNALYSAAVKWAAVPNQVSGPGIYPAGVDMHFAPESEPRHSLDQLKALINQPFIFNAPPNALSLDMCQRNYYYFNNASTQVQFRSGNVTFGPSVGGTRLFQGTLQKASADGAGNFFDVHGFSACLQQVGFDPITGERCDGIPKYEE